MAEEDVFRQAFKVFDKDGSGKLSREELKWVLAFLISAFQH